MFAKPAENKQLMGSKPNCILIMDAPTLHARFSFGRIAALIVLVFSLPFANAQLYVANGNVVGVYNLDGTIINSSLITAPGIIEAIAVFGPHLFVSSVSGTRTVGLYTTNGATVNASLITGLNYITDMVALGPNLFMTDFGVAKVKEYDLTGSLVNGTVAAVSWPVGLAIVGTDLYVLNNFSSIQQAVGKFTTAGTTINSSLISGLPSPQGIAVSGTDIFIRSSTSVGKYTTAGATTNASLITGLNNTGEMAAPIAVLGSSLFIADGTKVSAYNLDGSILNGSLITGLSDIGDIAVVAAAVPEPSIFGSILGVAVFGIAIIRRNTVLSKKTRK